MYNPPLRGGTVLLWFGPLLVLLIGAGIVYRIVRRRAKVSPATPSAASSEEDW
ncbi:cytochrome c-type biogenesis protein CcmH [Dokdonella sp.]|uniref:cytochrome c-type biogenesis protein CcmH n=1 Tax=Dokdonella sp. TaxID=2291710 RepID=UPI003C70CE92